MAKKGKLWIHRRFRERCRIFSFTTLTTVGYGNMVSVGALQGLALLEAVIGAMYPPIMIGRLLTLLPKSKQE